MIDNEKIINIQRMSFVLYDIDKSTKEYDENDIDNLIKRVSEFSGKELNDEEYAKVKKNLMMRCQVKLNDDGAMVLDDYNHTKWYDEIYSTISTYHWDRYKNYLLDKKHFGRNIINRLEHETLRDLMNFLGNPSAKENYLRRGLIIGDVQSGKTSTYTGLICKAADAGYKVIILLTGTTETLRVQTQQRIEEGFVGANLSLNDGINATRVGVGIDNQPIDVSLFTSRENDFTGKSDQMISSIDSNKIVLFVIKKNFTVLKKLIHWLIELNADPIDKKLHYPMLLIDDEADNASINTRKDDEEPAAINKKIRELIDIFTQSNYVGFTATPFANIFINPEFKEDIGTQDLFPENFIYCLPTPTNYIGANKIFAADGEYRNSVKIIKDASVIKDGKYEFYCNHNKEWNAPLPDSMTDAIYAFLLANAIRDLRNDKFDHRSMLINLSRFIKVQQLIKSRVEKIYNEAYVNIKYYLTDDLKNNINNPILKRIYDVWKSNYSNLEYTWNDIAAILLNSIETIQIKIVNSGKNSDKIDYESNKKEGLRVIAIGGLALSRGLTLEGLIVSYFFRNTATYDVLMQMGRWFGYRDHYDDLFKIWVGAKSYGWYSDISRAADELKSDMKRMNDLNKTPKDFGIRVWNDCKELGITAKNKMRTAKEQLVFESYFGDVIQAPYIDTDAQTNKNNIAFVERFVQEEKAKGKIFERETSLGNHFMLKDIKKENVLSLINKIKVSSLNSKFDTGEIYEFLISCDDELIDNWDVFFAEGEKDPNKVYVVANESIYLVKRSGTYSNDKISLSTRGQITGPTDALQGLYDESKKLTSEECYRKDYFEAKGKPFNSATYPAKTYFKYIKRKPLLMIYFVELPECDGSNESKEIISSFNNDPAISFAIGLPFSKYAPNKVVRYKANKIYFEEPEEE